MSVEFPGAVPEMPVEDLDLAIAYYVANLGFNRDWGGGDEGDGIAGISCGDCRIFLASRRFRENRYDNTGPAVIWINLDSIAEVDALHELWRGSEARIVFPPESKPWKLYEFTAADLDGNFLRVFYDFSRDS